jgi:hypothetical protein
MVSQLFSPFFFFGEGMANRKVSVWKYVKVGNRSFVWIGLLALLACDVARAQASAGAGEVACAFNKTCGSGGSGSTSTKTPPINAAAAAKFNEIQNNLKLQQQTINNAGNAILNVVNSARNNNGNDSNSPDPDKSTNTSIESSNADSPQPEPTPSSSAAVSALLDSDQPSNYTASAVSALLGNGTQPGPAQPATGGTTTANAVAGLLDDSKVSDSASAFSLPMPADPQINAVLQESADQPDQNESTSWMQALQSGGQQGTDKLTGLVTSAKNLLNNLSNDQTVQWFASQGWTGTTAPLPTATDGPDTVGNLVQGQAIVGFGDLLNGMAEGPVGFAKGLYSYGSKMVNQMGAALGFANSNIVDADTDNQN